MAIVALGACSGGEKDMKYRGLSMALPFQTFIDSLTVRGFAVDSAKTDSAFTRVVMANPNENFRLMLAQKDGQLLALQENYKISTNDSLRRNSALGPTCRSTAMITRWRSSRPKAVSSPSPSKTPTLPRFRCFTRRSSNTRICPRGWDYLSHVLGHLFPGPGTNVKPNVLFRFSKTFAYTRARIAYAELLY